MYVYNHRAVTVDLSLSPVLLFLRSQISS